METNDNTIETIRLAIIDLEKQGFKTGKVLLDSIKWLYERYLITGDERYLQQSMKHMQVYLEEGNHYEDGSRIFDYILEVLKLDKEEVLLNVYRGSTEIKANKSQVRRMLGRWNPHIHSMSIKEVIDDIIDKVNKEKEGTYYYYSGRVLDKGNQETAKDKYRLTIRRGEAQFWDMRRNLYYTIKK